jgi:hypothetical protein
MLNYYKIKMSEEEFCRLYPYSSLCKQQEEFFEFRQQRPVFQESPLLSRHTKRRMGVREVEDLPTTRRMGVREVEEPTPRRMGVREVEEPTPRRMGVREVTTELRHKRKIDLGAGAGAIPTEAQMETKAISRKIQRARKKVLKKLDVGVEEVEVEPEMVKYAHLAQGAYRQSYNSKKNAENYIREVGGELVPELKDFEIVPEFSNQNFTAYRNPKTGERVFSVRGSDAEFYEPEKLFAKPKRIKNASDWLVNLHTVAGKDHKTGRYRDAVAMKEAFARSEGVPVEEVNTTGHSLGGGLSDYLAEIHGGKSYSFNPARNPFVKRQVKPGTKIKTWKTLADIVSAPRSIFSKTIRPEPEHIETKTLNALVGTETDLIEQHSADQFSEGIKRTPEGKLITERNSTIRNITGTMGGTATKTFNEGLRKAGGLLGLIAPFALEPEYHNADERKYRKAMLSTDLAKGALDLSAFGLASKGMPVGLVDYSGTMLALLQTEGAIPDEAITWVRHKLGIQSHTEPRPEEHPKLITKLNKLLDPLFGRYTADKEIQKVREYAERQGITFEEAMEVWTAREDVEGRVDTSGGVIDRLEQGEDLLPYQFRDPETGKIYREEYAYQQYLQQQESIEKAKERARAEQFRRSDPYARSRIREGVGLAPSFPTFTGQVDYDYPTTTTRRMIREI